MQIREKRNNLSAYNSKKKIPSIKPTWEREMRSLNNHKFFISIFIFLT